MYSGVFGGADSESGTAFAPSVFVTPLWRWALRVRAHFRTCNTYAEMSGSEAYIVKSYVEALREVSFYDLNITWSQIIRVREIAKNPSKIQVKNENMYFSHMGCNFSAR